jgi:hypothetical protein
MSVEQMTLEKCWFCAQGVADGQSSAEVGMHKIADRKDLVITLMYDTGWESATVHVPRCRDCKVAHDGTETHVQRGALVGLLIGLPLAVLSFVFYFAGIVILTLFILATAAIGGMVGWAIGKEVSPKGVRDQELATAHPYVRRKEAEGWKVGSQPAA